jgi:hypothetical protein
MMMHIDEQKELIYILILQFLYYFQSHETDRSITEIQIRLYYI